MNDADRFRRVDEVFRAALREPLEGRRGFLTEQCGGDVSLLAEVDALLREDAASRGALDSPVLGEELRLSRLGVGATRTEQAVPERIGRYRVQSRIGVGGMGTVYEAEQENPRRQVAVKVINHGIASAAMLKRFEFEAQLLGRLQHPGIAQIYEAGVYESERGACPFFAMELVRGRPLMEYADEKRMDTAARLQLIARVADAVHHAHQRGVIHRDLKPANILVDGTGQPRILDFGVARAVDADLQTTMAQTEVGQLVGTVAYMSPEQAGGDPHDMDTRSDVYALGVVTYELLGGRLPYEISGRSVHEAVRIIREQEPAPISTVNRVLRGDVQTIVSKALEKEKTRRYDSASALAEDIRRYLSDQPIAARPASAVYQLRKFARRHRAVVVAGVMLMAGLAGAAVFSAVQASRAEAARALAAGETELAVARLADLRALSKVLIFDVHDSIKDLPGATPAREKIVNEGLKYLDALTAEAGNDRAMLHETIQGYTRIGEILGNPGAPSLGKFPEAHAAYSRGLELLSKLPAPISDRELSEDAYAAARLHSDLANLTMYQGNAEEALEHARAASRAVRPFKGTQPSLAGMLASALAREVRILTWMGRPREALEVFREAYAIDEALLEAVPEEHRISARRNFIADNIQIADMHRQLKEYPQAIDFYRKAFAMAHELVKSGHAASRRMRNTARMGLGKTLRLSGEAGAALVELEAVNVEARALLEEDSGNVRPLQDLLVSVQDLGDVHMELGRHEAGLKMFREQIDLAGQLAELTPENVENTLSMAFAHERAADALLKLGNGDEAIREYAAALEHAGMVRSKDVSVGAAHEIVVVVNRKLGELWLNRSASPGSAESRRAAGQFLAALDVIGDMEARSITPRHSQVDRVAIEALLERARE